MKPIDPREARLPKWAQAELDTLRRELRKARDDFEEYADTALHEDTVVVANPYDEHPRPLAREGERVRFLLDGVGGFRWVDVSAEDDALRVHASTGLVIVPTVTNVLHLSLNRD